MMDNKNYLPLFIFFIASIVWGVIYWGVGSHKQRTNSYNMDSLTITNMFDTVLTKEVEKFDFAFWEREKDAMEVVDKWLSPNLHVSGRYLGDSYELIITPKDSYFSLYKRYYTNGIIWFKGYRFTHGGFDKGMWYFYDKKGRLTDEEDQDIPFTFSFEDLLVFCERENIKIDKGYWERGTRESATSITNYYAESQPEDIVAWIIYYYNREVDSFERIVLDGKTGSVQERVPYIVE